MRILTSLLSATLFGSLAHPSLAATLKLISADRVGAISASDGPGSPVSTAFNVGSGPNESASFLFDQCVNDNGRSACLNVNSAFHSIGFDNSTAGFFATGDLSATKPSGAGLAVAQTYLSIDFEVSGVPAGTSTPMVFAGTLSEYGGNGAITLTGPGVSLSFGSTTSWNQVIGVTNGMYSLLVVADATLTSSSLAAEAVVFSVNIASPPPPPAACSQSSASCYLPHQGPGCEDDICCSTVCSFDPFCCAFTWDSICVGGVSDACSPGFISSWATDPESGHRYRMVSSDALTEVSALLANNGTDLVSINSGPENHWVRREFAEAFPGLSPLSMYIGFSDLMTENSFSWTNGSPTSLVRWDVNEPSNLNDEDAVVISGLNGRWYDVSYGANYHALAESFNAGCAGATGSCFATHGPNCDDESCCNEVCFADPFCCAVSWDGDCVSRALTFCNINYFGAIIVNPTTRSRYQLVGIGSWLQAAKVAIQKKGHLVTIEDAAENEWLRWNLLIDIDSASIGLTDQKSDGAHRWIGGQTSTYTNWGFGEPNNGGGNEDYTMMYSNGGWNDVPNELINYAIIEIPCEGDLNGDGDVGGADLAVMLGAWGSAASAADFDRNSFVDGSDLAVLLGAWGPCPTSNACVIHDSVGSDQPGCTICVCQLDSFCCNVSWDGICVSEAKFQCNDACQCGS